MSAGENDESSPFQKCDTCAKIYRTGSYHECPEDEGTLPTNTVEDRERLSQADHGDPGDTVLHTPGRADQAYHEARGVGDGGEIRLVPECGARVVNDEVREWRESTRHEQREKRAATPAGHATTSTLAGPNRLLITS